MKRNEFPVLSRCAKKEDAAENASETDQKIWGKTTEHHALRSVIVTPGDINLFQERLNGWKKYYLT